MIRAIDRENPAEEARLSSLKGEIWPEADAKHYGTNLPEGFFDYGKETLVYEENGQLIGYLAWRWDAGVAYINSLGVHPAHRRRGVATQLKEALEESVRAKNCHKIMTETGLDWSSRQLNNKLGYEEVVVLRRHFGKKDAVLFQKFLD